MHDLYEWLRLFNLILAVAACGMFFVRINDVWRRNTVGGNVLRVGIMLLFVAVAVASGASYLRQVPVGFWVPIITAALLVVLAGLFISRNDYDH